MITTTWISNGCKALPVCLSALKTITTKTAKYDFSAFEDKYSFLPGKIENF